MKALRETSHAEREGVQASEFDAMSVERFAFRNSISRAQTWKEIANGRLTARKVGTRTIITKEDATAWRLALPKRNGARNYTHSSHPSGHPRAVVARAIDKRAGHSSLRRKSQENKPGPAALKAVMAQRTATDPERRGQ